MAAAPKSSMTTILLTSLSPSYQKLESHIHSIYYML